MASFRTEPFLWIHLAGIAVVPLALLVMLTALAVGTPFPLYGLELALLLAIGWLPVLAMQWFRPFEIFSLLVVALQPTSLQESQLRILSLFKRSRQRWITLGGALVSVGLLWLTYHYAPLAYGWVDEFPQWRWLALLMAAVAYLLVNLFLQVPLSVVGVLLTSETSYQATPPVEANSIGQQFTVPGWKLRRIPLVPQ